MASAKPEHEWLEVVSQLATPIDLDALIAAGILKRQSKLKYVVLDATRVPGHVWRQARAMATVKRGAESVVTITRSTGNTTAMKKTLVDAVGARRAAELIALVAANGTIRPA